MLKVDNSRICNKNAHYAEAGQVIRNGFAFCEREGDTIFPLHKTTICRDFLNDALVWTVKGIKKPTPIYGFATTVPMPLDKVRMLVVNSPKLNVDALHKMESEAGVPLSEVHVIDKNTFYVEGDAFWLTSTVHLSFWTYSIRAATYEGTNAANMFTTVQGGDKNLLKGIDVWKLVKALKKLPQLGVQGSNYDESYTLHDYNGFYSALNYKKYNKYGEALANAMSSV